VIAVVGAAIVLLVLRGLVKRRQSNQSTLGANQAAQQVQSPYAALYSRDSDGTVGRLLNHFFRSGGF
jgi:hypothetical protein